MQATAKRLEERLTPLFQLQPDEISKVRAKFGMHDASRNLMNIYSL